jgi:hypothetical protein
MGVKHGHWQRNEEFSILCVVQTGSEVHQTSLNVRDHVSHPYRTEMKILSFLCVVQTGSGVNQTSLNIRDHVSHPYRTVAHFQIICLLFLHNDFDLHYADAIATYI